MAKFIEDLGHEIRVYDAVVEDEDYPESEETVGFEFVIGEDYQLSADQKAQLEPYERLPRAIAADADFYQGVNWVSVLQRKSDGKLFGFEYFEDISKHGDTYIEADGYDYDAPEGEKTWFVYAPIKPGAPMPTAEFI